MKTLPFVRSGPGLRDKARSIDFRSIRKAILADIRAPAAATFNVADASKPIIFSNADRREELGSLVGAAFRDARKKAAQACDHALR
jgi:hypothetical protein